MDVNAIPEYYQESASYPAVCVERENVTYAKEMLDNVGGNNSEMSAVGLYFYNSVILNSYKNLSEIFHRISIVEMHHLDIFARMASQLGEDPRLWTQKGSRDIYWSPSYNRYPRDLKALLINALEGEKAAIDKYERQVRMTEDKNIVENLKRIIKDEQVHVEIFQTLLACY